MPYLASLPMYDWPEIASSTDQYWQALLVSLKDHGFSDQSLPKALLRETDPHQDWLHSNLLLSQTCGLPYVRDLRGKVTLLGAPHYDIDCAGGSYFSVIIGRKRMDALGLEDIATKRFAYNDSRSQSGFAAFQEYLLESAIVGRPSQKIESGSHRRSIKMVADGQADIAAIDAVTWALALRHEPAAKEVMVIAKTAVTPGLPYIASLAFADDKSSINAAVKDAISAVPKDVLDALLLTGYHSCHEADYDVIRTKWDRLSNTH